MGQKLILTWSDKAFIFTIQHFQLCMKGHFNTFTVPLKGVYNGKDGCKKPTQENLI